MSAFRLSLILPLLALACGGSSAQPAAPVAQAGADQAVASGAVVTLDGSASSDPSGLALTYQWTQSAGLAVTLSSATAARPTFTAPALLAGKAPAVLVFSLQVSSANGSSTATVTITVSPPPGNPAPIASAGSNQSVVSGAAVTLDGSLSHDPDGEPLTYAWTAPVGVTLSSATAIKPTFNAPSVPSGSPSVTLTFSLVVSDASASSSASTVSVIVNPVGSATCGSGVPPPPPGTPPAPPPPSPPPAGNPSNRFQLGTDLSTGGVTVIDPAAGEPTVQGFVVVAFGPNRGPAPDDAVVTVNGVPLTRVTTPGASGLFWQLDPLRTPQPVVGSGGELVLVATATDPKDGKQIQRSQVIPCPSDIPVTITPALGSALVPSTSVNLTSSANILLNQASPTFSPYGPKVTLRGYEPCTRALGDGVSLTGIVTANGFNVDVPVLATTSGAYLLDLRWPGPGVLDGETGGYCQLSKRFFFTK